ncbi:MAG TPA: HTH domain-containing protein [Nitrososphaeraceae archaeon]|nr:HTH domain-containing protein [Nitrososphaeraceae archaeon]
MAILKSKLELYLQQIFRMLLESKTEEAIAKELGVSTRTIQRYKVILDQRYGLIWKQKTNDTLFLECNLFKNRMLKLYKALEDVVTTDKTSGLEKAKCAEIAANIAIDVLKMESEGIRAVKELLAENVQGKNILDNLHRSQSKENEHDNDESNNIQPDYDPNRKF